MFVLKSKSRFILASWVCVAVMAAPLSPAHAQSATVSAASQVVESMGIAKLNIMSSTLSGKLVVSEWANLDGHKYGKLMGLEVGEVRYELVGFSALASIAPGTMISISDVNVRNNRVTPRHAEQVKFQILASSSDSQVSTRQATTRLGDPSATTAGGKTLQIMPGCDEGCDIPMDGSGGTGGTPPPAPKKVAVVLFNFNNYTNQDVSSATVRSALFTDQYSLQRFWSDNSFGVYNMQSDAADTFGWITISATSTVCNPFLWKNQVAQKLATLGKSLAGYDEIINIFANNNNACSWDSLAEGVSGKNIWLKGWKSTPLASTKLAASRIGFNHGVGDAHGLDCNTVPLAANCTSRTLSDAWDVMGGGAFGHFSAERKKKLGWFTDQNFLTLSSPGTYNVSLNGQDSQGFGLMGIRFPSGAYYPQYYSIEYRSSPTFSGPDPLMNRGAIIHLFDLNNYTSRLIDAGAVSSPNNFGLSAMTDGQTINFPQDHVSITQVSHGIMGVNLNVTISADTVAPSTSIVYPSNGSVQESRFYVNATAADDMVVTSVELYKNGSLIGTAPYSPTSYYDFMVDIMGTTPGTVWNLQTKAYDLAGNSTLSTPTAVTIIPETVPPYVSIDNPSDGTQASGGLFVQVSSYDNSGQVCSIDFYIDGVLKAHDPLAMGEFNADLTPYTSGSTVVFTATATDCAGNTSTSPPVHIGIE